MASLVWLHLSDIHFRPKTEWRDAAARQELLRFLKEKFSRDSSLVPDCVFCTGDIAFGEERSGELEAQYAQAELFFAELGTVCNKNGIPLEREKMFVVPGNHDVNRRVVNRFAQEQMQRMAGDPNSHTQSINQGFNDLSNEIRDCLKRLDAYGAFVSKCFPHQYDPQGRSVFSAGFNVGGVTVGVAGFNTSWTAAGPEDDRKLWMAAEWQFNATKGTLEPAQIRIAMMHHPPGWLNAAERDVAERRLTSDFTFVLHGHEHNARIDPGQSCVKIAAGAIGAEDREEFGINIVQIDLERRTGQANLFNYDVKSNSWMLQPVPKFAPEGVWHFDLPQQRPAPRVIEPAPRPSPPKRVAQIYGREELVRTAASNLNQKSFLLVHGLRGIGKTTLIQELAKQAPLNTRVSARFSVWPETSGVELFRQISGLLGETAERPLAPTGSVADIASYVRRRYPNAAPAWVWIENAHLLMHESGFREPSVRSLLLGLSSALGAKWKWILELRERPAASVLGDDSAEVMVPGLGKESLAECLAGGAPEARRTEWTYAGHELKKLYQWLGGGHGSHAHPLATQLLIEVARGSNETPLETLDRHRKDFDARLEEVLLSDLYESVLNAQERRLMHALSLYRNEIPHDHADQLEKRLNVAAAWDGLDRRFLLSTNPDHSLFYLHSIVASWVRQKLGCEDLEGAYSRKAGLSSAEQDDLDDLHRIVALCWLDQLKSRRGTRLNISRALEAFFHLTQAGETERLNDVAVDLLGGCQDWAQNLIYQLYERLRSADASLEKQRDVLKYALILDRDNARYWRFLGECYAKLEGWSASDALNCFRNACDAARSFAPNWANLGRALQEHGPAGAQEFLSLLDELDQEHPDVLNNNWVVVAQAKCLELVGRGDAASALRQSRIMRGSLHTVLFNDEAVYLTETAQYERAIQILDLAEDRHCSNSYSTTIRSVALQRSGDTSSARALRLREIEARSQNAAIYVEEAKACLTEGEYERGLAVLDRATENGCSNDYVPMMRAALLERSGRPEEASIVRVGYINSGTTNGVFYIEEARYRSECDDTVAVEEVLQAARRNKIGDALIARIQSLLRSRSAGQ